MSHEIRTPLSAIITGISNLSHHIADPDARQTYLKHIDISSKILKTLVNEGLDLSSIEAGRFKLTEMPFNIHQIVKDAIEPFKFKRPNNIVHWKVLVEQKVPAWLHGDPMRLTQVLMNLVNNAVKFTERGELAVQVTLEKDTPTAANLSYESDESIWLHFSVRDTGIGIPEEEQPHVFEQFFQGSEANQHETGGTGGIGMFIVKKIVDAMGEKSG
jgi:signal transduction histidine kinase